MSSQNLLFFSPFAKRMIKRGQMEQQKRDIYSHASHSYMSSLLLWVSVWIFKLLLLSFFFLPPSYCCFGLTHKWLTAWGQPCQNLLLKSIGNSLFGLMHRNIKKTTIAPSSTLSLRLFKQELARRRDFAGTSRGCHHNTGVLHVFTFNFRPFCLALPGDRGHGI